MLVLSRKPGETIHIGDRITITVVRAHGNRIKIGIDAPDEFRIVRGELDQWSEPPVPDFRRITKAASAATLFHSEGGLLMRCVSFVLVILAVAGTSSVRGQQPEAREALREAVLEERAPVREERREAPPGTSG